jgi:hypothetical protein
MSAKAILSAAVSVAPVYVEDVFSTFLYTGNGATRTITNGIDLNGKGGLVWVKARNSPENHGLYDTARGANNLILTNSTQSQLPRTVGLTSFTSSGFTLGLDGNFETNTNNTTYASWTFRKQAKFFDVVTYTGTGSNTTIAHNLGSVPGSIIVKRTDTAAYWAAYHRSLANTQYLVLNTTATAATGATWWNSTTPTSSVFSVGTGASINASGGTYVAYLFAHDAGGFGTAGTDNVVSCGSFTANAFGTATVSLGYEPQWILTKRTNSATDWQIYDNMRGFTAVNVAQRALRPNLSSAESVSFSYATNATGFSLTGVNGSDTFVYIAIRRGPMKTPTVGTSVFALNEETGSTSGQNVTTNFPVDMGMTAYRTLGGVAVVEDRIRGYGTTNTNGATPTLLTSSTAAEATGSGPYFYNAWNTTITRGNNGADPGGGIISWFFRRAPGFFDVVAYTGTGAGIAVNHNLGVTPELIIGKCRSAVFTWVVYHQFLGTGAYIALNTNASSISSSLVSAVSAASFTGEANAMSSSGNTHIAYLFATLAGVSKVGSYTGTGTTKQIDCGFTAGARFVLIKRTDSTGDWYVWDTARGIISGNDSYLLLNSSAAEVTSTDYIDPLSSGFEISSTAPAAINANGGSYIFLSIA